MVNRHAAMMTKRLSGEQILSFYDEVIPLGYSQEKLAAVVQPISAHLGIKTGKKYSETLTSTPGTVIVAAICSLAKHGQALQQVQQFEDGCLIEATLPSDVWSLEGVLSISVRESGTGSYVDCATTIKGQLFDWGKSKRCLKVLVAEIKSNAA